MHTIKILLAAQPSSSRKTDRKVSKVIHTFTENCCEECKADSKMEKYVSDGKRKKVEQRPSHLLPILTLLPWSLPWMMRFLLTHTHTHILHPVHVYSVSRETHHFLTLLCMSPRKTAQVNDTLMETDGCKGV